MPLIRAKRTILPFGGHGLVDVRPAGDRVHLLHAQDVENIARANQERRKDPNKQFTEGRTMQRIASIPELVFYAHPELAPGGVIDKTALYRFLRTPEGEMYKTTTEIL